MSDYITEESHDVVYMTWDSEKNLLGYTVGKFMKAYTLIPNDLNDYNIPLTFIAKGWVKGEFGDMISSAPKLTEDAINKQNSLNTGLLYSLYGKGNS